MFASYHNGCHGDENAESARIPHQGSLSSLETQYRDIGLTEEHHFFQSPVIAEA
jgi:hypothetical protein